MPELMVVRIADTHSVSTAASREAPVEERAGRLTAYVMVPNPLSLKPEYVSRSTQGSHSRIARRQDC